MVLDVVILCMPLAAIWGFLFCGERSGGEAANEWIGNTQYVYRQLITGYIDWDVRHGDFPCMFPCPRPPQLLLIFSFPPLTSDLTCSPLLDTILMTHF